jgi:hypothetical protein
LGSLDLDAEGVGLGAGVVGIALVDVVDVDCDVGDARSVGVGLDTGGVVVGGVAVPTMPAVSAPTRRRTPMAPTDQNRRTRCRCLVAAADAGAGSIVGVTGPDAFADSCGAGA